MLPGRELSNWTQMYIDDLTVGETHAMERAKYHISSQRTLKTVHAYHCEDSFNGIKKNADAIGMVINNAKTQLICVSANSGCDIKSYINADGQRIDSVSELKVLGFVFDERPTVDAHVNYSINKFNKAIWALRHLKRANINTNVLLEVYKIMLRPLLEYSSVIYHPMLTKALNNDIERQQKLALKTIYGFENNYEELLVKAEIDSLEERRKKNFTRFANSLVNSERWNNLFPLKDSNISAELRSQRKYKEVFARSERLYNSPLFAMRRDLNNGL